MRSISSLLRSSQGIDLKLSVSLVALPATFLGCAPTITIDLPFISRHMVVLVSPLFIIQGLYWKMGSKETLLNLSTAVTVGIIYIMFWSYLLNLQAWTESMKNAVVRHICEPFLQFTTFLSQAIMSNKYFIPSKVKTIPSLKFRRLVCAHTNGSVAIIFSKSGSGIHHLHKHLSVHKFRRDH